MVDLKDRYRILSNRESGFGRYDVVLEPKNREDDGIILEFKIHDEEDEKDLADTVSAALEQIEEKQYATDLVSKGIPKEKIKSMVLPFRERRC